MVRDVLFVGQWAKVSPTLGQRETNLIFVENIPKVTFKPDDHSYRIFLLVRMKVVIGCCPLTTSSGSF